MSDTPTIAIIAAGEMGAGIGRRLTERGARVLTSLTGRGDASRRRAEAAGMVDADEGEIAGADMLLSIVPPADALALAQRLVPALEAAPRKPLYVDCNAVSPQSVLEIAAVVEATGTPFVDAGIIGFAPKDGHTPAIYASGVGAPHLAALNALGLDVRIMDGAAGRASALKMSYAALTKGLHALGAAAFLGAIEAGVQDDLFEELKASQPGLLSYFVGRTQGVFPKAYRWVAEMREIGAFLGGAGETLYEGAALEFERLAKDHAGDHVDEAALRAFLEAR